MLNLYKLHFAPELPFLHIPSIKEKLGRKHGFPQPDNSLDFSCILLGVLTLTARFHDNLVKYITHLSNHQPNNARYRPLQIKVDPATTSEYYANVLTIILGPLRTSIKTASIERVQAWLMLGMYEWSRIAKDTDGLGAWICLGNAIRLSQHLGLGSSDRRGHLRSEGRRPSHKPQVSLENETKKRTIFSCFILDRMLSCGKERVIAIQRHDLQIQLLCSKNKFDLAMEV